MTPTPLVAISDLVRGDGSRTGPPTPPLAIVFGDGDDDGGRWGDRYSVLLELLWKGEGGRDRKRCHRSRPDHNEERRRDNSWCVHTRRREHALAYPGGVVEAPILGRDVP